MSMPATQLPTFFPLDKLLVGIADAPALPILDIAVDSRAVSKGALFIATQGLTNHGLDFIEQAIANGAIAVAYNAELPKPQRADSDITLVPVRNLESRLGEIADRFFGAPSEAVRVVGVTGTNGKTTVAWLVAECLSMLEHRCAYAGTLGYGVDELYSDSDMTSPDVVTNHRRLAGFRDRDAEYAAIEISSHALDQHRIDGTRFRAVLFTNLSRDHLDYHGDMGAYAAAKARLFTEYPALHRVINIDSEYGGQLAAQLGADAMVVSMRPAVPAGHTNFVCATSVQQTPAGSTVSVTTSVDEAQFILPIPGRFNVANALTVLGLLLAEGVCLTSACDALAMVSAPPGRMQRVPVDSGPQVYIDYAHTPDALRVALTALREHQDGELWCVFGCGGDRDAGKRPLMAQVVEELADRIVITNDNPRSEDAGAIVADIVSGFSARANFTIIEDRASAIGWAIANAKSDDALLIAGKGHEDYQIIGVERRDFSDFKVAAANLDPQRVKA